MINQDLVRTRVRQFMKKHGTQKKAFGLFLGNKEEEPIRTSIRRADAFFEKRHLTVYEVNRAAEFIDKSVEWLLSDEVGERNVSQAGIIGDVSAGRDVKPKVINITSSDDMELTKDLLNLDEKKKSTIKRLIEQLRGID